VPDGGDFGCLEEKTRVEPTPNLNYFRIASDTSGIADADS
jgi:hypothetical protein